MPYRIRQYIESSGNYCIIWVVQALVDEEVLIEERAPTLNDALFNLGTVLLAELHRLREDIWLDEYRGTSGA